MVACTVYVASYSIYIMIIIILLEQFYVYKFLWNDMACTVDSLDGANLRDPSL